MFSFRDKKKLNYSLWNSAKSGNFANVKKLLKDGANVNSFNTKHEWDRKTALLYAAENGNLDIFELLLNKGANVDYKDESNATALHWAAKGGHETIVKLLVEKHNLDVNAVDVTHRTALHWAANEGHEKIVRLFIEQYGIDVNIADEDGNTALHLACWKQRFSTICYLISTGKIDPLPHNIDDHTPMDLIPPNSVYRTEILKLFEPFKKCHTNYSIETYCKVFVCGNTTVGKSSLCQVINSRSNLPPGHEFDPSELVTGVTPLTTGMECHTVSSLEVGNVVLHDFAGHLEYYSSHVAVLQKLMLRTAAVFVVIFKLTDPVSTIERELYYWFNFIDSLSAEESRLSQVIVVGSHVDVFADDTSRVYSLVSKVAAEGILKQKFKGVVFLDCRCLGGDGISSFVSLLHESCSSVFDRYNSVSYYCHVQYSFLLDLNKVAIRVNELSSLLKEKSHPSLPSDVAALTEMLTVLSNKGLVLFLPDSDDPSLSWIIIDKSALLTDVVRVLFAPSSIQKVHKNIASDTGIITLPSLMKTFPHHDPQMIIGFLNHLELCHVIPSDDLNKISTNISPLASTVSDKLLFIPSLLSVSLPAQMSSIPSFGWCLWCPDPQKVLSSRFFHRLIHQIAHEHCFSQINTASTETKKGEKVSLDCEFKVWTNGIYLRHGDIEALLEISESNRCFTLLMSEKDSISAQRICSSIIWQIVHLKNHLSPCGCRAYIILPDDLPEARGKETKDRKLIRVRDVIIAIFLDHLKIYDQASGKEVYVTDLVGSYDPLFCISPVMLQKIYLMPLSRIPMFKLHHDHLQILCPDVMALYPSDGDCTYHSIRQHLNYHTVFCTFGNNPLKTLMSLMNREEQASYIKVVDEHTRIANSLRRRYILALLAPVADQWFELGNILEAKDHFLGCLRKKKISDLSKLGIVIANWLRGDTMLNKWEYLITKLEGPFQDRSLAYKFRRFVANIVYNDITSPYRSYYQENFDRFSGPTVTDYDLKKCSRYIVIPKDLAAFLRISDKSFAYIEDRYKNIRVQCYWIMKKWTQKNPFSTLADLIELLKDLGCDEAVKSLTASDSLILQNENGITHT